MVSPYTPIVLHKSEWERIQRKPESLQDEVNDNRERIKQLNDLSQQWIKTWPDTVAGHIALVEKQKKQQKEKQRQEDIEFLKAYTKKMKAANTVEAIKEARHMIFQNSSDGRQLLSALLESKAFEEREAQIKFRKALIEEEIKIANEENKKLNGGIYNFNDKDEEREKKYKLKRLENNRVNKEILALKKQKEIQEQLAEKKPLIEDENFMKQVIEIEKNEQKHVKRCEKQKLEDYIADSKQNAKLKEHDHKLVDAITDVYKREKNRIWLKTREVMRKIHHGRPDEQWSKNLHEKVKKLQDEETKRYEDFIDKGVKTYENKIVNSELEQKTKDKEKISSLYLTAQRQLIQATEQNEDKKCKNKCVCEKQTLALISNRNPPRWKTRSKTINETSNSNKDSTEIEKKICIEKGPKLPFLSRPTSLTEELRKREKEPSPFSGTTAAHAHFAEQANQVLKEIQHKHLARKVVEEYRKVNCLDKTTLPISLTIDDQKKNLK